MHHLQILPSLLKTKMLFGLKTFNATDYPSVGVCIWKLMSHGNNASELIEKEREVFTKSTESDKKHSLVPRKNSKRIK